MHNQGKLNHKYGLSGFLYTKYDVEIKLPIKNECIEKFNQI